MGVGVDEARVRHVLADVHDRHLVTGERQHLVPGADRGHVPSSMRRASATGGSSIVTIRPTMTRVPDLGAVGGDDADGAADAPPGSAEDDGATCLLGAQPTIALRASRTSDRRAVVETDMSCDSSTVDGLEARTPHPSLSPDVADRRAHLRRPVCSLSSEGERVLWRKERGLAADDRGDHRHGPDLVGRGSGDIAAQDRDVAQRARRQVAAPASSPRA